MKLITINNKKINIKLKKGYFLGSAYVNYIERGIDMKKKYGFLYGKAKKDIIGRWEIYKGFNSYEKYLRLADKVDY